jgi:hypothetical protein
LAAAFEMAASHTIIYTVTKMDIHAFRRSIALPVISEKGRPAQEGLRMRLPKQSYAERQLQRQLQREAILLSRT